MYNVKAISIVNEALALLGQLLILINILLIEMFDVINFPGKMRLALFSIVLLVCSVYVAQAYEDTTLEDDDFAEFEQFDADDDVAFTGK